MMDIVLSFVFALPLLIIMIYPAMKITEYLETKIKINDKQYNRLTVAVTIILSIIFGILFEIT